MNNNNTIYNTYFKSHTSEIDWCESNYSKHLLIAEFVNTISNIVFLVICPFAIYLSFNYAKRMGLIL